MELRTLKYFLAVAQEEGVNRAAEAVHVTQPTLSRQLLQLEDELGTKLFVRGPKKITLTDDGILFRRRAEEILSLVEKAGREIGGGGQSVEGKISFGCGELSAVEDLARLIKRFCEKFPLVTYDILTASADLTKEQLEKGLLDIGVLLEPVDMEKFEFRRMPRRERWIALMRPDDALAGNRAVTPEDLRTAPLILPRRANVRNEIASWFGDSFSAARILFEINLSTNGALMVREGLGRAVVIEGSLPFLNTSDLVALPLSPALTSTSVFAWKRGAPFSPAVRKFIGEIKSGFGN